MNTQNRLRWSSIANALLIWIIAVLVVLLFVFAAQGADLGPQSSIPKPDPNSWTKLDTALELSYAVVHIMDWSQTRYGARHTNEFREQNPILGTFPHKDKIDLYFASTLIAHFYIAYKLPKHFESPQWIKNNVPVLAKAIEWFPARTVWQMTWIGIETNSVSNNASIGVRYRF